VKELTNVDFAFEAVNPESQCARPPVALVSMKRRRGVLACRRSWFAVLGRNAGLLSSAQVICSLPYIVSPLRLSGYAPKRCAKMAQRDRRSHKVRFFLVANLVYSYAGISLGLAVVDGTNVSINAFS
jgi:hypothetical protein